jgi:Nif-specific regulatory protein
MAQLEIRTGGNAQSVIELGDEPLPVGFDGEGGVAWGRGRVARPVAEVVGDVLRAGGRERRLAPGESVTLSGIELVYRAAPPEAGLHAAVLGEIGRLLGTLETTEDLLERVLDAVVRVLQVRRATIALFDEDEQLAARATRGEGLAMNPALTRAVVDSGAAILTSEAAVEGGSSDEISIDVRSVLCAPLRHEGQALGVLYADNEGRSSSFTNDELDFASALAHLASFALGNLARTQQLRDENTQLKRRLRLSDRMVLASGSMEEIWRKLGKVAGFDATVLVTGESGVGKEMVAHEIHRRSPRAEAPFVPVNCAAIPETLLESELFGWAPQSGISGADPKGRAGKFEQADRGTIFLDEIGEMRPNLQSKLLRVLEDKMVDRLGGAAPREVDVRIVVATNQDLEHLVKQGRFREDLFYRLQVVTIHVPPLRERREEIAPLAEFFIRTYPDVDRLRHVKLSSAAARALGAYGWPGNVRELRNCIEQALILGDGKAIRLADLPQKVRSAARGAPATLPASGKEPVSLAEVEKEHIARVLEATGWNKARSSRILGISKPTLYEKIRSYGLLRAP